MAASLVWRPQTRLPCNSSLRSPVAQHLLDQQSERRLQRIVGTKTLRCTQERVWSSDFSHSHLDRCGFHGSRSIPSRSSASFQALYSLRSTFSFRPQRFSPDVLPDSEFQTVWSYPTVSSANGSFITMIVINNNNK